MSELESEAAVGAASSPGDLWISFYGDDFTGSTDALEFLARAGVRSALFLEAPRAENLPPTSGLQAIGFAGGTRALPTDELEATLRPALRALRSLGAPIVHYKMCSTFDSSPQIGSVGRVLDTGNDVFENRPIPLVVGAPTLGRYCVFGNLFARSGLDSVPFRLDRHPTMRSHPVTPMDESDLRVLLSRQTAASIALLDVLEVSGTADEIGARFEERERDGADVVLVDILRDSQLEGIGELLQRRATVEKPLFAVGSSAIEMALARAWRQSGRLAGTEDPAPAGRATPVLVLSGSCSPVTRRQIEHAAERDFQSIALSTAGVVGEATREAVVGKAVDGAIASLRRGRSVIVHSGLGPDDPRIRETLAMFADEPAEHQGDATVPLVAAARRKRRVGEIVGGALGAIGRGVLQDVSLSRLAVTGGDTSGHVARALGMESLEYLAPLAPGSPLCRARAPDAAADGLEVCFKGGQVGRVDFFERLVEGSPG